VFKPSTSKKSISAGGIDLRWAKLGWGILGSIVAAAVLAAIIVTASPESRRAHDGSTPDQRPAARAVQPPVLSAEQRDRPLAFEANQGQTDPRVKYVARGNGYAVFLTANDTVFAMTSQTSDSHLSGKHGLSTARTAAHTAKPTTASIYMRPVGGNSHSEIAAGRELPGYTNYYIGSDPSKWQQGVKQYATVSYRDVYPGVDMAFHGHRRQLEFDFIVAPGADAARIAMGFTGARKLSIDPAGNLLLATAAGDVVLHKPVAYQERDGKRELVEAAFDVKSKQEAAFRLGAYDHQRELVIDPSLSYATYLGGSNEDEVFAIAVDGSGNAYVTGQTKSPSFPLLGGKPAGPTFNVFVTKVNPTGTAFVYNDIFAATGAGLSCSPSGTGSCSGNAIAVDNTGNAYVAGAATAGFPTLAGFQTTFGGGTSDAFALKLNPVGALVYSTFLGGTGSDNANAIAIDGSGNAYVTGETQSPNFPTRNPIQSPTASSNDAFITEVSSTGTSLVYSTVLGGSSNNLATGIALDSSNNAYVAGITQSSDFPTTTGVVQPHFGGVEDGFVTEVKADGSAWVYSTYLGGSGQDDALGIAVDAAGEAYVTGQTGSTNFPTVNPAQKALGGASATNVFVTKLNAGATTLLFSTYYGGTQDDVGAGIALDSFGDAYVTGKTTSSDYPVSGAFQNSLNGPSDAFVTEFSNTGFVVYSSFLGGAGTEDELLASSAQAGIGAIAVDSASNAYVAGATGSTDFPASAGAAQPNYAGGLADGFVAKVGTAPADFSVAVAPTAISTTSGQSTSAITVTVSSVNATYGQAVALSCGSLPSKAVCHFTSASVTPGSSAATSSLTIATNGASSSSHLTPNTNRSLPVFYAMFLPIGGIALLGMGKNSRRKRLFGILLLGIILMGLLMLPACGGSGGGGGGGNNTAPGTYNITVSGQGGGASHSAPLTFTVH
jgi:hypothetical protein